MGQLLQMTDELHCCLLTGMKCSYRIIFSVFIFRNQRFALGAQLWAWSHNMLGLMEVFYVCRENLCQWEKISRGEVEDIVPSRPYDSGPVKVDNWLPKGLLARQRNTTCILPRTLDSVGGRTHILRYQDTDQRKATWLWKLSYLIGWRRCQQRWFHRSGDWQTVDGKGLKPITLHPNSLRINLVEWTLVVLFYPFCVILCFIFYVSWFFYGLVFAEALLWTFHRLEYVKSCRFRLFFFLF